MPINTRELMEAVGALLDKEGMRVTLKTSAIWAAVCGVSCFVGGLLAGPIGLAVGGSIGAMSAGFITHGKFQSVSHIIMHEMSDQEREKLKEHVEAALSEFHPLDVAMLLHLLMENAAAKRAVLSTVTSFITNEMGMQIVD